MDKVESPAISLHIYGKLICDTGTKMIKLTNSYLMVLGKKKKKKNLHKGKETTNFSTSYYMQKLTQNKSEL